MRWKLSWSIIFTVFQIFLLSIAKSNFPSPAFGVGTQWFNTDDDTERSSKLASIVYSALDKGYRHIDCAQIYNTYKSVSQGLHRFLKDHPEVSRKDIFITDKIWNTHHSKEDVFKAVKRSLEILNTPYIDMLLMHYPISWTIESDMKDVSTIELKDVPIEDTWNAMQELVSQGLVHKIGVSNFNAEQLTKILSIRGDVLRPAINQIECHPHLPQLELIEFSYLHDIETSCYGPLVPLRTEKKLDSTHNAVKVAEDLSKRISTKDHKITPAQILLKYVAQQRLHVVTTTSKPERLVENLAAFSDKTKNLTEEEMSLFKFPKSPYRHFNPTGWEGIKDKLLFNDDHSDSLLHSEL